jgi:hypothetical protein
MRPPTPAFVPATQRPPAQPSTGAGTGLRAAGDLAESARSTTSHVQAAAPVRGDQTATYAEAPRTPGAITPPVGSPPAGTARRVPNPFLASDPNQKARRLARALVSDMIAYNPQKREEGTRDGTLKQLFRDEIRKSYEEYVEQIGRDFAEATTHFQDALNEILAGGKRMF